VEARGISDQPPTSEWAPDLAEKMKREEVERTCGYHDEMVLAMTCQLLDLIDRRSKDLFRGTPQQKT